MKNRQLDDGDITTQPPTASGPFTASRTEKSLSYVSIGHAIGLGR